MMKNKINNSLIICLIIFSFLNNKSIAQDCINGISFSNSTVNVGQNSGSNNITVFFPSGCSNSTITNVTNLPSWITNITISNQFIGFSYSHNGGEERSESLTVHIDTFPSTKKFTVVQQGCQIISWYEDSDNDGLGDLNGIPIQDCYNPDSSLYVSNNNDHCPLVAGSLQNQGCPEGEPIPENINWTSSKSYDFNGNLINSGKSYFDDLGKPIQSQSWDIATDKIWVNQTMYDSQGRPALQTLSAPIDNLTDFNYKTDFIKKSSSSNYTTADFENNPENPTTVSSASNTLGWYYSTANQRERFQDVTPYPFSRTIYSHLNPGSVLKTIGGNKVDVNGTEQWVSGFTYSMPAAQELSQSLAFGDNEYNNIKTIKTISRDVHGVESVVFTDTDGKVLAAARSGATPYREMSISIGEQGYIDLHVPSGNNMGFTVSNSSAVTVYDLITEQTTTASRSIPNGFYRVAVNNLNSYSPNSITVNYRENYYDYSLNEYDKTGRLIASYQPVGSNKASKPVSTFDYNTLGQLTHTKSPDEGDAWFKYRKDGQIRFSQNSKQLAVNEFSYTNYDNLGRPVESGVIVNSGFNNANPDGNLPSRTKKEQTFTVYDIPESLQLDGQTHEQTFVAGNVAKTYTLNPSTNTTWYSYDVEGKLKWMIQDINGLGKKYISYNYNTKNGLVSQVNFQGQDAFNERFAYSYNYNDAGQVTRIQTSFKTSAPNKGGAGYEYYENGSLKRVNLGEDYTGGNSIQGIDYVYNLNGQLKAINHPSLTSSNDPGNDDNDVFGMELDYHNKDYRRGMQFDQTKYGKNQLNGNIKGMRWRNALSQNSNEFSYKYDYNRNNWLTEAVYGEYNTTFAGSVPEDLPNVTSTHNSGTNTTLEASNSITLKNGFWAKNGSAFTAKIVNVDGFVENSNGDYNVTGLEYDANGNIQKLNRNKQTESGSNAMDKLSYRYKTDKPNQLLRVDDDGPANTGADDIKDQNGDNYIYNEIGQLTRNVGENLDYLYNTSGLVTEIKKNNVTLVKFYYNERGQRIKKESYNTSGSLTNTYHYIADASGSVLAIYKNGVLKEHPIHGVNGRIGVFYRNSTNTDGTTVYQIADHLGNVRALISGETGTGSGLKDYYPGGMPMPGRTLSGAEGYRYGYQGEFAETDAETGKPAFELRMYDPRINRWLSPDPYGQYNSPYLAMGNDWMNKIDPDGGFDWYKDEKTGDVVWFEGNDARDGFKHLGYFASFNDIEGNNTFYDGVTQSSFYNGEFKQIHLQSVEISQNPPYKTGKFELNTAGLSVTGSGFNAFNGTGRSAAISYAEVSISGNVSRNLNGKYVLSISGFAYMPSNASGKSHGFLNIKHSWDDTLRAATYSIPFTDERSGPMFQSSTVKYIGGVDFILPTNANDIKTLTITSGVSVQNPGMVGASSVAGLDENILDIIKF